MVQNISAKWASLSKESYTNAPPRKKPSTVITTFPVQCLLFTQKKTDIALETENF